MLDRVVPINRINVGLFECNSELIVASWNELCEKITGYSELQIIDSSFLDVIDRRFHDVVRDFVTTSISGATHMQTVNCMLDAGLAADVWLELRAYETTGVADTSVRLISVVMIDVSQRKVLEKELADSNRRFKTLVENMKDSLFLVGPNKKISYCSPAIKKIIGYDHGVVATMALEDVFYDELAVTKFLNYLKDASLGSGFTEYYIETSMRHKNGHEVFVEIDLVGVFDESGEIEVTQGIVRNITPRKEAEALSEKNVESLEQKTEALTSSMKFLGSANRKVSAMAELSGMLCDANLNKLDIYNHVLQYLCVMTNSFSAVLRVKDGKSLRRIHKYSIGVNEVSCPVELPLVNLSPISICEKEGRTFLKLTEEEREIIYGDTFKHESVVPSLFIPLRSRGRYLAGITLSRDVDVPEKEFDKELIVSYCSLLAMTLSELENEADELSIAKRLKARLMSGPLGFRRRN